MVELFVLPLFALANSGLACSPVVLQEHETLVSAIILGLVLCKPIRMTLGARSPYGSVSL